MKKENRPNGSKTCCQVENDECRNVMENELYEINKKSEMGLITMLP